VKRREGGDGVSACGRCVGVREVGRRVRKGIEVVCGRVVVSKILVHLVCEVMRVVFV
jgi:hypothetical protein